MLELSALVPIRIRQEKKSRPVVIGSKRATMIEGWKGKRGRPQTRKRGKTGSGVGTTTLSASRKRTE